MIILMRGILKYVFSCIKTQFTDLNWSAIHYARNIKIVYFTFLYSLLLDAIFIIYFKQVFILY